MIQLNVQDETSKLETVILGIANDKGPSYGNNPKSAEHIRNGTAPTEQDMITEVEAFREVLEKEDITVLRPQNILLQGQKFTRDIAFVIDNKFIKANMKHRNRACEYGAISHIIKEIGSENILLPPKDANIEGGDVILCGDTVFIGIGDRTDEAGYKFIQERFKNKEVIPLELNVTGESKTHILHLDCTFHPVGHQYAIFYQGGFKKRPDAIYDIIGENNLIKITSEERYDLFSNILSISPVKVISETGFIRLNQELEKRGIEALKVPYAECSKNGGLFRCSTLPLYRQKSR